MATYDHSKDQVMRIDLAELQQLTRIAEAIEAATGTDTDTAAWLAGRVLDTLDNMTADSQNRPRPEARENRDPLA